MATGNLTVKLTVRSQGLWRLRLASFLVRHVGHSWHDRMARWAVRGVSIWYRMDGGIWQRIRLDWNS